MSLKQYLDETWISEFILNWCRISSNDMATWWGIVIYDLFESKTILNPITESVNQSINQNPDKMCLFTGDSWRELPNFPSGLCESSYGSSLGSRKL